MKKLVDGVLRDMTQEEVAAWTDEQLIANNPDRQRASKWEAIKAHRDRLSDEGGYRVAVNGVDKWFHSDPKSKTQQLALTMMGANVPAVQWKTMDGTFVTMSQALAAAIFHAAALQDMAIFAAAEAHKLALQVAADPAGYQYVDGWPDIYSVVES